MYIHRSTYAQAATGQTHGKPTPSPTSSLNESHQPNPSTARSTNVQFPLGGVCTQLPSPFYGALGSAGADHGAHCVLFEYVSPCLPTVPTQHPPVPIGRKEAGPVWHSHNAGTDKTTRTVNRTQPAPERASPSLTLLARPICTPRTTPGLLGTSDTRLGICGVWHARLAECRWG